MNQNPDVFPIREFPRYRPVLFRKSAKKKGPRRTTTITPTMATFPTAVTSFPSTGGFPVFSFQTSTANQSLQALAPPPVVSTITPQWLINLFSLVPENERQLLSTLTEQDLITISQVQYQRKLAHLGEPNGSELYRADPSAIQGSFTTGKLVLTLDDNEVVLEMMGFLRKTPVEQLLTEVRQCRDRTDLLWLANQHRDGYLVVAREVFILQAEESGIKGLVKCRRCQSSNVLMMSKQLRAGDEPTTIFTRCVDCKETWKQ